MSKMLVIAAALLVVHVGIVGMYLIDPFTHNLIIMILKYRTIFILLTSFPYFIFFFLLISELCRFESSFLKKEEFVLYEMISQLFQA